MGEFPENNGDSQFSFTTFHKRVSNNGNLYVAFSVDEDYVQYNSYCCKNFCRFYRYVVCTQKRMNKRITLDPNKETFFILNNISCFTFRWVFNLNSKAPLHWIFSVHPIFHFDWIICVHEFDRLRVTEEIVPLVFIGLWEKCQRMAGWRLSKEKVKQKSALITYFPLLPGFQTSFGRGIYQKSQNLTKAEKIVKVCWHSS